MDRRTRKTQALIQTHFLALLEKKPISKISVTEIAERADIGRGTFYTHYKDVYDLQDQLVLAAITEFLALFDDAYPEQHTTNFQNFANELVTYTIQNKQVFQLLLTNASELAQLSHFKEQLISRVIQAEVLPPTIKSRIEVSFAISGILGVLADWLNQGITVETTELIETLETIMTEY